MFIRTLTTFALAVCMLGLAAPTQAKTAEFNRIIAFGDSLTDDGTGVNDHNGFGRYTNGDVWVEYFAHELGITSIDNRAWGGAKTGQGGASGIDWSGLQWQVAHFQPHNDLSQTLVTVWIGYNDVYDGKADIDTSIGHVATALSTLTQKGVDNLLVLNLFDMTYAPAYNEGSAYAQKTEQVRALVQQYNQALYAMLFQGDNSFAATHPDVALYFVDAYSLVDQLIQNNVFKNMQTPWSGSHIYPQPGEYMWWDNWHPMTAVHKRIGQAAADAIRADDA